MNLYNIPVIMEVEEVFEALLPDHGILIERIISSGQTTPAGEWLNPARDEWVALLQGQARLAWADGRELIMQPGDWVFIAAGEPHRVDYTSAAPPCIWLAVHGNIG